MFKVIPNVPPKLFSLSAVAIGYLLIDDLTANEQNALGNWLMLVAQVLCTNAYYMDVQDERKEKKQVISNEEMIRMIEKMVVAMNQEIQEMKQIGRAHV